MLSREPEPTNTKLGYNFSLDNGTRLISEEEKAELLGKFVLETENIQDEPNIIRGEE